MKKGFVTSDSGGGSGDSACKLQAVARASDLIVSPPPPALIYVRARARTGSACAIIVPGWPTIHTCVSYSHMVELYMLDHYDLRAQAQGCNIMWQGRPFYAVLWIFHKRKDAGSTDAGDVHVAQISTKQGPNARDKRHVSSSF